MLLKGEIFKATVLTLHYSYVYVESIHINFFGLKTIKIRKPFAVFKDIVTGLHTKNVKSCKYEILRNESTD
jgi:hypothetical protein